MKKERFLDVLGQIDDKYIEDAEKKKSFVYKNRLIAVAASLVLVVSVTLIMLNLLPTGKGLPENSMADLPNMDSNPSVGGNAPGNSLAPGDSQDPGNSDAPPYEDRYDRLIAGITDYLDRENDYDMPEDSTYPPDPEPGAPDDGGSMKPGEGDESLDPDVSNGEYIEVTDNQVAGIIEGDLAKTTEKYIFRYGTKRIDSHTYTKSLRIYTIDGEDSTLVSEFVVAEFDDQYYDIEKSEIYLSADGKTVTVIRNYAPPIGYHKTGIISIDVSDVNNPTEKGRVSLDGTVRTTRMIDGKLYVVTNFYCYSYNIDIENPETFIPGITVNGKEKLCSVDDIVFPDEIEYVYYSYITVFGEDGLELIDEKAVMDTVGAAYFTKNHILLVQNDSKMVYYGGQNSSYERMYNSKITPVKFSDGKLEFKDTFSVDGWTNNQYDFDEKDGYLRFVVTHFSGGSAFYRESENASLYVYDLENQKMLTWVDRFAPDGEGAVSVRFEGDKLYVCTAVVETFWDPVFFFDLSDYNNITYVDTGYIEGFSSSLIDMGEGYLLGVGYESDDLCKLELYKREGDSVVSVTKLVITGEMSEEYKSYLIDRENNLFGLPINTPDGFYFVVQIANEEIKVLATMHCNPNELHLSRAFYRDGYVYLTTYMDFYVQKVDVE